MPSHQLPLTLAKALLYAVLALAPTLPAHTPTGEHTAPARAHALEGLLVGNYAGVWNQAP